MSPDDKYEEKEKSKESTKLAAMVDNLTPEQRQRVFSAGW